MSSATCRTSPRGCKRSLRLTASSSPRSPADCWDLFDLDDLGPQELKSVAGPTLAWAVVRESSQASRFDTLHSGRLSPLVGREQQIGLLLRSWVKAKEGQGHVVLLSGEAGIGKSRLTAAFLERLAGEPYARLRFFCSPQHTNSAFYPISGHLTRRARLAREEDAKTTLDKLDPLLAMSAASRKDAMLLAEICRTTAAIPIWTSPRLRGGKKRWRL